ncbi:MAG: hypothetical protein ACYSYV_09515 [Planctomycetota bacterium]|jgi:hypothetical protein
MKRAENIEKIIKNVDIDTNAERDRAVLADVLQVLQDSKGKEAGVPQPNIWRIIMKKPIAKLVTAAAVILIAAIGISLLQNSATTAYTTMLHWIVMRRIKKLGWNMTIAGKLKIFESIGIIIIGPEIWWQFGKKVDYNTGQRKTRRFCFSRMKFTQKSLLVLLNATIQQEQLRICMI